MIDSHHLLTTALALQPSLVEITTQLAPHAIALGHTVMAGTGQIIQHLGFENVLHATSIIPDMFHSASGHIQTFIHSAGEMLQQGACGPGTFPYKLDEISVWKMIQNHSTVQQGGLTIRQVLAANPWIQLDGAGHPLVTPGQILCIPDTFKDKFPAMISQATQALAGTPVVNTFTAGSTLVVGGGDGTKPVDYNGIIALGTGLGIVGIIGGLMVRNRFKH